MKKIVCFFLLSLMFPFLSSARDVDLFILAGQSNAQGWQGNAAEYPADPQRVDKTTLFYWVTPGFSSSAGKWTTMKAQGGRFPKGHFGLEVSFSRLLGKLGYRPAIFKYTLGATSIARDWKGPGDGKMYDQMVTQLRHACGLLEKQGHKVCVRAFIWIQGESDADNSDMAQAFKRRLQRLINDLRDNVVKDLKLPVILGIDEQHPCVRLYPEVVRAQQELAKEDTFIAYTTMYGLQKADCTHLTPKALVEHGKRIFDAYRQLTQKNKLRIRRNK